LRPRLAARPHGRQPLPQGHIAAAIERLSMEPKVSVKQIAADPGYANFPAFSHAFRQVTGKTPTEFAEVVITRESG
jgi:AraC-like DNA-binding protein